VREPERSQGKILSCVPSAPFLSLVGTGTARGETSRISAPRSDGQLSLYGRLRSGPAAFGQLKFENYRIMTWLGLVDTLPGTALPYTASAFGFFLLRQTFKTVPRDATTPLASRARCRSCSRSVSRSPAPSTSPRASCRSAVTGPTAWPLIVTNSVEARSP
jgi:hypothetical protein